MIRPTEPGQSPFAAARLPAASNAALAIDATAIAAVSLAICAASHRLLFMTLAVPVVIALRFALWMRLPIDQRWTPHLSAEVAFFVACTLLGSANDWNSVVRHHVYDYDVPAEFPSVTTIPLWMLLYWGLIVRAAASLSQWLRSSPAEQPRNDTHIGRRVIVSAGLKVFLLGTLVVVTRQLIYRYSREPVLSWFPFAVALLLYAMLFRPGRRERVLGFVALVGGPAIEMLYIHVGHLHHYQLGWIGGVPLWIVLWWVLAMWVWSDLSLRVQLLIAGRLPLRRLLTPARPARRALRANRRCRTPR
jgi:hypothetical protein